MRFAVIASLPALLGLAAAHVNTFLDLCLKHDVKVSCAPACPRICMNNYQVRKCRPAKCKPGCACAEGWVRKDTITGPCIQRSECKRWIL
ncbi:venom peptide CtAPI [Drosophila grimshawi]|uniref:venom peptide CtAPI n=1 Tax=Drosophila grimshawi TaxID=7222 RepID=UPI000C870790|nr:venom peptide CtAPI [Drosophila grimshawi]